MTAKVEVTINLVKMEGIVSDNEEDKVLSLLAEKMLGKVGAMSIEVDFYLRLGNDFNAKVAKMETKLAETVADSIEDMLRGKSDTNPTVKVAKKVVAALAELLDSNVPAEQIVSNLKAILQRDCKNCPDLQTCTDSFKHKNEPNLKDLCTDFIADTG